MAYYAYDNVGRLLTLNNVNSSFAEISYFFYGRDANGNVTSITRESTCPAGNNVYYTYDALDRPVLEEHKTGATVYYGYQYNYDAASNRYFRYDEVALKATYWIYDPRNLMTQENAQ
jgi:YD repeat-containing protein